VKSALISTGTPCAFRDCCGDFSNLAAASLAIMMFLKAVLAVATYTDLVLVGDDNSGAMDADPAGRITLRTIACFKGNSTGCFTV